MNETNKIEHEDEISLLELWNIFKNHFNYFLITVIIVLIMAFLYLQRTVPTYSTNVTVLVDPIESSSSLTDVLSMSSGSASEIATEVALIKSEKNMQNALDSMNLDLYINSENIPYSSFYTVKNAIADTTVSNGTETKLVTIEVTNQNPVFAADLANSLAQKYDNLLTGIAKNSKTVQREFLEQQIPLNEELLQEASNKLSDFRESSGIMQLNEKASSLVNQIAFFDVNKEPLKLNKQSNEESLKKYKEELALYSIDIPSVSDLKNDDAFTELVNTFVTANDKLLMYNLAYYTDLESSSSNSSSSVNNKTTLLTNTLKSTSNRMLDTINKELSSYRTSNSYTNKLIAEYAQLVLDEIKTDIELTALDSRSKIYNDELDQLPIIERQVSELTRNVTVLEQVGLELRTMLEQTKLTEAAVSGNVTVIDRAKIPTIPVSPNKLLIMAVALLLGMALGFFVCIIFHLKKNTIETRSDLKDILNEKYKLLGWIPLVEPEKNKKSIFKKTDKENKEDTFKSIPTYDNPSSLQSEKYMAITSNIIYGNFLTSNKVISVTSCDISAGKSSVIANIGMCLAKMGSRVIIIDGDFRMPSALTTFGYSQAKMGSVEVITGRTKLENVIVQPVEEMPNFNILPVGHKPQLPSAILAHPYFTKMIDVLKANYDYVLIDTPPLDYASEVLAIGKISDSIVLIARAGITVKNAFKELIESLGPVADKIIGAVLNGFIPNASDLGGSGRGKYGYGKKYGYSYGFAYADSENRYDSYTVANKKRKNRVLSEGQTLKKERRLYEQNLKNRGSNILSANSLNKIPPLAKFLNFGNLTSSLYSDIEKDEIIKSTKVRSRTGSKSYLDIIKDLQNDADASGMVKQDIIKET